MASATPVIKKGVKGNGLLGNIIIGSLLNAFVSGADKHINIKEFAEQLDIMTDELRVELALLYQRGVIETSEPTDWMQVNSFTLGRVGLQCRVVANALPGTGESQPAPSLDDLHDEDNLVVECGVETVPNDDGDDSYDQPITFRIGLVPGQEDDTLELSVVRSVSDLYIGETIEVEGVEGKWAKVIEQKVLGPGDPAELRGEAVAFVKEMLAAYNPTDIQRRILGLPEVEVIEGDSGGPLTLDDSAEDDDNPPQEAAS